ncbi:MAG: hypothetical protein FWE36_03755 [Erysipelotrichales bacterium]|nr:hypothetical protein [Erysipelotrichales bacterium]
MFEILIVICFYNAFKFMPLRKKSYKELSQQQYLMLQKQYSKYSKTRKGKNNPRKIESYFIDLQKQAMVYLIMGISLIVIYIPLLIIIFIYGSV